MKRLIKYTSSYDDLHFSDCSTEYEVLPILVEDSAGPAKLLELAKQLGLKTYGNVQRPEGNRWGRSQKITHTICIGAEPKDCGLYFKGPIKTKNVQLGFITFYQPDYIPLDEGCNGILTSEQAYEIYNNCDLDIREVIDIDGESMLLIESWSAYHHLEFLGYKFKQLMELEKVESTIFDDSVFSCSHCGTWDHNDSGYTYNYRIVDCEQLGTNLCECHHDHTKENYTDRINDHKVPLELETAESLEEEGKLEHLERFIGGMTDGRGGSYGGESCNEGDPESILENYQSKFPDTDFIFTHDESGQFQTYFSIWKVK